MGAAYLLTIARVEARCFPGERRCVFQGFFLLLTYCHKAQSMFLGPRYPKPNVDFFGFLCGLSADREVTLVYPWFSGWLNQPFFGLFFGDDFAGSGPWVPAELSTSEAAALVPPVSTFLQFISR